MDRSPPVFSRVVALTLLLVAPLPACHSWKVRTLEEQRLAPRPETLRVTLPDGERRTLEEGVVAGDSVTGMNPGGGDRVAIASTSVLDLNARVPDMGKTVFLVFGAVVPIAAVVALLSTSTCGAGAAPSC